MMLLQFFHRSPPSKNNSSSTVDHPPPRTTVLSPVASLHTKILPFAHGIALSYWLTLFSDFMQNLPR